MKRAFFLSTVGLASALAVSVPGHAEPLVARVDVPNQIMTVSRYGTVIHTWKVSTARRGFITPAGSWRPKRIHKMWYSRKYDLAPMPYAVFYDGGYAVHGTTAVSRLGSPASHGCVRLETANAKIFYDLVREIGPGNTRVIVMHEPDEPATAETGPDSDLRLTTREG